MGKTPQIACLDLWLKSAFLFCFSATSSQCYEFIDLFSRKMTSSNSSSYVQICSAWFQCRRTCVSSMVWFTSKKSRHKSMWRAKRRKDANFERLRNLNTSQRQKSPEMVWKSQEWKRQDLAFIIFIYLLFLCFNFIWIWAQTLTFFTCLLTKQYSWMEVLHLIWYFEKKN